MPCADCRSGGKAGAHPLLRLRDISGIDGRK
jgi:hypothetical protein